MNSVDKQVDTWNGRGLDMEKDILRSDGKIYNRKNVGSSTWNDETAPLDNELGTGQLNIRRALNQFSSGQYAPGQPGGVPTIGWSKSVIVEGQAAYKRFVFDRPLQANSYVSITLTWNRPVDLVEPQWWSGTNPPGVYDAGDTFNARRFQNLDLFLMKAGEDPAFDTPVWSSRSTQYNVEHLFSNVRDAGNYEFWVKVNQPAANATATTNFAVAWWAVGQPSQSATRQISGVAWNDANNDGEHQINEGPRAGVRAYLYTDRGEYVATTVTNAQGEYTFSNLNAWSYYVSFLPPIGTTFTTRHAAGVATDVDSDATVNGYSGLFTAGFAGAGDHNHVDVGLQTAARVGGGAWLDANGDGTHQVSEDAAEGVYVSLYDDDDNWIDTTVTDDEGNYEFVGLDAGDYYVTFGRLPAKTWTTDTGDSEASPTTGQTTPFTSHWART